MVSEDGQNDGPEDQFDDAVDSPEDESIVEAAAEDEIVESEAGGSVDAPAEDSVLEAEPAAAAVSESKIGMNRSSSPQPQKPPVSLPPEKTAAELKAEKKAADKAEREKEDEHKPVLPELDPHRASLPWYVVHTYSGFEMRVKASLEERIRTRNLTDKFGNIVVPQETVVELVRGQKKTSTKKFFPGYILVQMFLDDETWHLVKDTPKVTEFVGDSRNPSPLTKEEVASLILQMEGGGQRPRSKVQYEVGDAIKVVDGPFAEFNGTVDDVKPDKGKLRVLISIFGRNTPVELDFVQVEKV